MGRPLSLRPRLLAVCAWIRPTDRVADIGTDHARLPVYLMQRGLAAAAYGLDIADGPLARAHRTVATHRMEGRVILRRSDGAAALSPGEVDTAVITGMGGGSIGAILRESPWLRGKRLILGPHTRREELLAWLRVQGYCLEAQQEVLDAGKIYKLYLFYPPARVSAHKENVHEADAAQN